MGSKRPLTIKNGVLVAKRGTHAPRKKVQKRIINPKIRENPEDEVVDEKPKQNYSEHAPGIPEATNAKDKTLVVESRILDIDEIDKTELRQLPSDDRPEDLPVEELEKPVRKRKNNNPSTRSSASTSVPEARDTSDGDNLPVSTVSNRTGARKGNTRKAGKRQTTRSTSGAVRKKRTTKKTS